MAHHGGRTDDPGCAVGIPPGGLPIPHIQKHSNEVWRVLAAVKTEFGKFGGILDKVSKKLQETQNVIDVEVGCRRRAMDRKLKGVEVLPEVDAVAVLELDGPEEPTE